MLHFDDKVVQISEQLRITPLKAKYMLWAYDIEPCKINFLRNSYRPSEDGIDPALAFCRKCMTDDTVRKDAYKWLDIMHDLGGGNLVFSNQ